MAPNSIIVDSSFTKVFFMEIFSCGMFDGNVPRSIRAEHGMRWLEGSYEGQRKKPPSDDAVADGGNQRTTRKTWDTEM
jgi:hypothetical protein